MEIELQQVYAAKRLFVSTDRTSASFPGFSPEVAMLYPAYRTMALPRPGYSVRKYRGC
jgi:hypothetical protein